MPLDDQTIIDNATAPRKAVVDGVSVEQHPLPDLLAARRELSTANAVKGKTRGLLYTRIQPPGTVSTSE